MAEYLDGSATDEDITDLIRTWLQYLAEGDYESAFSTTAHDPYYRWTPALMRAVVNGYGLPDLPEDGVAYEATAPGDAQGDQCLEIERWETPITLANQVGMEIGLASSAIPLDGRWSELTATFRIMSGEDRTLLVLNEIHVF